MRQFKIDKKDNCCSREWECDEGETMQERFHEEETLQDRLMENGDEEEIIQERIKFNWETTEVILIHLLLFFIIHPYLSLTLSSFLIWLKK